MEDVDLFKTLDKLQPLQSNETFDIEAIGQSAFDKERMYNVCMNLQNLAKSDAMEMQTMISWGLDVAKMYQTICVNITPSLEQDPLTNIPTESSNVTRDSPPKPPLGDQIMAYVSLIYIPLLITFGLIGNFLR